MTVRYYVRVSSMDQKIDRQLLAYEEADYIYIDKMSGIKRDRPELERMLNDLQAGDTVVVKSIDRLSRSTKDLLEIVEQIRSVQANLHILDLQIDTSTAMGKCVLTILGVQSIEDYSIQVDRGIKAQRNNKTAAHRSEQLGSVGKLIYPVVTPFSFFTFHRCNGKSEK